MPTPQEGEDRDTFVARCVPIVLDDGSAESQDQAVAMCNSMWEEREENMDDRHAEFVAALSRRTSRKNEFGYGLGTADFYVLSRLECGIQLPGEAKFGRDKLIKDASKRAVYCNPDMVVEHHKQFDTENATPANVAMELGYVVTTPREDRDGDILLTQGAKQDPKAPLLWQHESFLPIGKVTGIVEQTKDILRAKAAIFKFDSNSELSNLARDAITLVEGGALRISHGFKAIDWEEREQEQSDGWPGFLIKEFEILEHSLVSVPSNIDAEVELWSRGKLRSDMVKAHAKYFWDARKEMSRPTEWSSTWVVGCSASTSSTDKEKHSEASLQVPEEKPIDVAKTTNQVAEHVKGGRVLSQRNLDVLTTVVDDLKELKEMSLSKAGEALCERAISRLEDVIKSADKPDEESHEPEQKQTTEQRITVQDAMRTMLIEASWDHREKLLAGLQAMRANRPAEQLCELLGI